jgi:membrane protein
MKLPAPVKKGLDLLKETASSWSQDGAPAMGAAISYYSMFSIAPLLMIVIAIAGFFFGADAVRGAVYAQLADLMGENGAKAIEEMLAHANRPKAAGLATLVSVIVLVLGAAGVFRQLQVALDRIWRAPALQKESGLWQFLRANLLSIGMVLGMAFLIVVSLLMSTALSALGKWWGGIFGGWELLAHVFDLVISFGMLALVFALIYKVMPRVHIRWHDVWIGAAVTAALFTIGKFLIGLYLGKSTIASSFGAFGSLVIVMVWVYYSAQIFLFGAEFTWVYAHRYGSRRGQPRQQAIGEPAVPAVAPERQLIPVTLPVVTPAPRPTSRRTRYYEVGLAIAFVVGGALGVWNSRKIAAIERRQVPDRRSPKLVREASTSVRRAWRRLVPS